MELNNNSETDSSKEFKSKFWYFYYFQQELYLQIKTYRKEVC